MSTTPLEPSPNDPVVFDAFTLSDRISNTAVVSLRLSGTIRLGSLTPEFGSCLLPTIRGNRVTLWSDDGAVLDAEGVGCVFHFWGVTDEAQLLLVGLQVTGGIRTDQMGGCIGVNGAASRLIMRESTISDCSMTNAGMALGGCIAVNNGGRADITDSLIEDCDATAERFAYGGGIGITGGEVRLTRTHFARTSTRTHGSGGGLSCGGGVCMHLPPSGLWMSNVTFERTSAISTHHLAHGGGVATSSAAAFLGSNVLYLERVAFTNTIANSTTGEAFGGGIGLASGQTNTVRKATLNGAQALSGANAAWGGGIGLSGMAAATVVDTVMLDCATSGGLWAAGGGVGLVGSDSIVTLYNVTGSALNASSADYGVALYAYRLSAIHGALVRLHHRCSPGDDFTRLIGSTLINSELLLRGLTMEAPACAKPIASGIERAPCRGTIWPAECNGQGAPAVCAGSQWCLSTSSSRTHCESIPPEMGCQWRDAVVCSDASLQTQNECQAADGCQWDQGDACGPSAVCIASEAGLPTLFCICSVGNMPDPAADNAALAPFAEGCVQAPYPPPLPPSVPPPPSSQGSGFESVLPLAAIIFGIMVVVLSLAALTALVAKREQSARWLRHSATHDQVQVEHLSDGQWHVFLSHKWMTAQDQVRVIKQRLNEMLPGVRCFLGGATSRLTPLPRQ